MNRIKKIRGFKKAAVLLFITGSCILFVTCVDNNGNKNEVVAKQDRYKQFAGSQACANCHKDIFEKHLFTQHHLTSAPVTPKNILGSFKTGSNVFAFDPFVNITMQKSDSGFYQVEYHNGAEVKKQRFDVVGGSGRKGQSYLSWSDNHLVQLPITYFTPVNQWSNSPGYNPRIPTFNRPITSRCLECHSTHFETISNSSRNIEEFDHKKIIYGIDCEKCHGPAADHVAFHLKSD